MRYLLTILLLFVSIGVFAQEKDERSLTKASGDLISALLKKDSVALKLLLSDDLSYGHSNGWIESKKEVISDLFNGKITYKNILGVTDSIKIHGNIASVRMGTDVDVELNGKPVQLKLSVLEVWIWENKRWVLFARQSRKF